MRPWLALRPGLSLRATGISELMNKHLEEMFQDNELVGEYRSLGVLYAHGVHG